MSEKPLRYYLSQTPLQTFEKCQRKYYYQYILIYYGESTYSMPLDFGSTVHDIMQKASEYSDVDRESGIQSIIYDKVLEIEGDTKKDYEGRLLKLVKPLTKISGSYTIVDTEIYVSDKLFDLEEFSMETIQMITNVLERKGKDMDLPLEGVWFGGFIDAVVKNGKSEDVIDWKTGRFSRKWLAPYERQIQLYAHLMRLNGRTIKRAKIVYVEQNGKEHLVDVDIKTCERVYTSMREAFRNILSLGENVENFNKVNEQSECNGCAFSFVCNG